VVMETRWPSLSNVSCKRAGALARLRPRQADDERNTGRDERRPPSPRAVVKPPLPPDDRVMPAQERGGREDQADARQVGQRGTVVAGPYETCAGSLSPFTTWHTIESLHSRLCIRLGMAFSFRDGSVPPVGEVALGSGLVFGVQPRYEAQWYASRGGCTRCRLLGVAGSVDLLASRADTGQVWIVARQTLLPPCVVSAFASPPHDWRCIWRFLQAHPIRALTQSSAPCASASGMAWPKPCTMCCARSPTLGWCAAASRPARPDLAELRVGDNHHHSVCRRCDASADVDGVVGDTPCLRADAPSVSQRRRSRPAR
jgi:hypothetical protein